MAEWLNRILGRAPVPPAPASPAESDYPPLIGSLKLDDTHSLNIRGYDSSWRANGVEVFIRRYAASLSFSDNAEKDGFIAEQKAPAQSVQPDGSISLAPLTGEGMILDGQLEDLAERLKGYGLALDVDAAYKMVSADMGKPEYHEKYFQPVAQKPKQSPSR